MDRETDQYSIDAAPEQIVRWLKTELHKNRKSFDVRATREYVFEESGNLENAGIGEDTDAASVNTVGILEIRPGGEPSKWMLELRAEDPLDSHVPEDHSAPDIPEEIDLEAFEAEFVKPERAAIYVTLHAGTPAAKKAFDYQLRKIVSDTHTR